MAWISPAHVVTAVAALTGLLTACSASVAARPGHSRTGCAQAHTPVAMIPGTPGTVTADMKPVAHVLRSPRFTRALTAALPAASEELRSDEQRLAADGWAFTAHTTARTARAVDTDVRAIQKYCA